MLEEKLQAALSFLVQFWHPSDWNEFNLKAEGYLVKDEIEKLISNFNHNPEVTHGQFRKAIADANRVLTPHILNSYIAVYLSNINPEEKIQYIKNDFELAIVSILKANDILKLYLPASNNLVVKNLVITAIRLNRLDILENLIEIVPNMLISIMEQLDVHNKTSMCEALLKNHPLQIQKVIEQNVPAIVIKFLSLIAKYSGKNEHLEYLKKLAEEQPTIFLEYKTKACKFAIKAGNLDILKFFISKIDILLQEDLTKLVIYSAQYHQLPILKYLSQKHPDLYKKTSDKLSLTLQRELLDLRDYINTIAKGQFKDKASELVNHLDNLEKEGEISKAELCLVANATYHYLKNDDRITAQQYQKLANEVEGHGSLGMKILGIVMIALGALAIAVGAVITFTSVASGLGAAATPVGIGGMALGSASFATGIGLFATKGCQHGLAKRITELQDAIEETRQSPGSTA
ncbi:MAG: hypothetical protein LCH30_06925 [Proteobacteria bacterium]|nr:hypothetical protein [Pseudomonadota bacterium]